MKRERLSVIASSVIAWVCFAAPLPAAAQARNKNRTERKIATREIVDETGRRQRVPLEVHRIVSLAPNITEILYALGAQDRVVGVCNYSDNPPGAKAKPRVGQPMNPSLEAIAGLKPDLVLMTALNSWETEASLKQMGISVYGIEPHTVEETLASITHIGDLIGASSQALEVVASLQHRLDALKAELAGETPARVLFVVWEDPLISVGNGTFIADALRWAGAESVVKTRQDWPQVSLEEVVRLEPDYIIYASSKADSEAGIASEVANHLAELRKESGWRELAAVREGHITVVSDEVNLPAPGLIDAIQQLARQIHPDAFKDKSQTQHAEKHHARLVHSLAPMRARSRSEGLFCAR
jgi:iron complex transport system substrate-binding protein